MKKENLKMLVTTLLTLAVLIGFSAQVSAYSSGVMASADNTIAGFSTTVKSNPVIPGSDVYFKINKPDGTTFETHLPASYDGTASFKLSDYQTRKAGKYEVCAKLANDTQYGQCSPFNVMAGSLSTSVSEVSPEDQVVKLGQENAKVRVKLTDLFGNPVPGHVVSLISNRDVDTVTYSSNISDQNGFVNFNVTSGQSGISNYTVYDLTSNLPLIKKAKIVYFDSASYIFEAKAIGASSGAVAYFSFSELPSNPIVGQSVSFTLKAFDTAGQVVTNYGGTVGFSVMEGSTTSATLPSNYTFAPQDLGVHTFPLGVSFSNSGKYTIKAEDLSSPAVYGTVEISVAASSIAAAQQINITNPQSGSYSSNIQIISGKTSPGVSLTVFDNGGKIGTATSSSTGDFIFTTGILADGRHDLYAAIVDANGVVQASSTPISITIDTTAPELTGFEITPSNPSSGSDVKVKVMAESGLSSVSLKIANTSYNLTEDPTGNGYIATFKAPSTSGNHPISLILIDALGNQTKVDNKYNVTVGESTAVGTVTGLTGYSDQHKVTLVWKAPTSGVPVKFYRVYYGLSANQLSYAIDTWGTDTRWYVPNLKNNTEYFFAVVAVDNYGNSSPQMSNIISAIPGVITTPPPSNVTNGAAGQKDIENLPTDASETGPEVIWLVISALLGGICYSTVAEKTRNW